jgi:hypothetical protein
MVKGTSLEGRIVMDTNLTLGNSFATALKNGQVDLLAGVGWTGSALDPFNLMEAYISSSYTYTPWACDAEDDSTYNGTGHLPETIALALNTTKVVFNEKDLDADGNVVLSPTQWYDCLMNNDGCKYNLSYGYVEDSVRYQVLAALENAVLQTYGTIPAMDQGSYSLRSYKINACSSDYVYGVGRGGIRYYTYNFTDSAWKTYIKEKGSNGILDYTK